MSCISRKEIREFIGIYRKEISESGGRLVCCIDCRATSPTVNQMSLGHSMVLRPAGIDQPVLILLNIYTPASGLVLANS